MKLRWPLSAARAPYVLPKEFTRYPGWTVEEIAEAGDVDYVEWLASDKITAAELRAEAAAQLPLARARAREYREHRAEASQALLRDLCGRLKATA